jgi:hypothetical protein
MEGFSFATELMGCYHIKLDADTQELCTIVFPWYIGKYKIQTLTHGYHYFVFPDVFQNFMSKLVQDMEYAKTKT